MRTLFSILFFLCLTALAHAQELHQVSFLRGDNLSYFTVRTEQDVLIRIAADGKVLEWGIEVQADWGNYYAPRLQPFMGRVEYYGPESDSAYRGKVKSIGTCFATYYTSYEEEGRRGKLRSLGTLNFDYYSTYDEKSLKGNLKQLGSFSLEYYRSYENEAYRGKLKAIGNMPITYYSAFDDKYNAGKLKSVGPANYVWYSQYDQARGGLKTNNYRQAVGGLTIVLQ